MKTSWLVIRPQQLPLSFYIQRRVPTIVGILAGLTLAVALISIGYGDYPIPLWDVVKTLVRFPTANPDYDFVINVLRLPRTIVAWGVGVGLAIAGTIVQAITRNPLAAPDIIGINAGASLAAVSLIVVFPMVPAIFLPPAALVGAIAVALAIYWLAWKGGSSSIHLILVGIGCSAIAGAFTDLLVTFGNIDSVSQALVWLAGSVYGRTWDQALALAPWLVVFGLSSLAMSRELNVMQLGDNIARSLGSRLEWQRGWLLLCSVALAGASVATAGTVGFVGLMSPHLARQLVGPSHQGLLPVAALVGGLVVVSADLVGRIAFAPTELPCGLITAVIGAPYFLYLLSRNRDT